ncbi:MAG: endo-1,4-beta-xylanase [Geminicoccaceae bacterium]
MRVWLCAAVVLALNACDQGTTDRGEPASWSGSIGRLVVDGRLLDEVRFERKAGAEATDGEMSIVSVGDAEFEQAVRLETLRQPPGFDGLEASLVTHAAIESGSPCWLHLNARAIQPQVETGLARLSIGFQSTEPRGRRALEHRVYVEPVWTSIDIPFEVRGDIEAGEARVVLSVGTQLQVIDVGDLSVRCFDPSTPKDRLPRTAFSYAGRAEDAPWREIAAGRIERYRKGELEVKVVDADGQPVPDAEIHVQMTRHAFKFGTAVDAELLAGAGAGGGPSQYSPEDTTRYRQVLRDLFNTVTFENSLNWPSWADTAQRRITEDALAWIKSLGLDLRGTRLVSARWSDLPRDLQEKKAEPETIRAAVRTRVSTTVGELDGRISEWDVVDRPREHHELMDLLGWEELDQWFKLAREAAAGPRLVLNESDILAGDRLGELMILLGELSERQVPIDAIGIKGHFSVQPPPIQVLSDRLDQLASFELPLVVTEFDIDSEDEALQADFTRDLLTLLFSHPSVDGVVFWGFWQGRQALPHASLYREDWAIKGNGEVYRDLVLGDWWTDVVAFSNVEGSLVTSGFQGDYMISARKDDQTATAIATLGPDGAVITIQLTSTGDTNGKTL